MIPVYFKSFKESKFEVNSFESLCSQTPLCEYLCRGCHVFLYDGIGPSMLFLRYVELYQYKGEFRRKEHVFTLPKVQACLLFKRIVCDYVR